MFSRVNSKLLEEIRDILRITQENQRDLIDLRERSIKMDQKVLDIENKINNQTEKAKNDDLKLSGELKEHTLEKFLTVHEYTKDKSADHDKLISLESRVTSKIDVNKKILTAVWVTAISVSGAIFTTVTFLMKSYGP